MKKLFLQISQYSQKIKNAGLQSWKFIKKRIQQF